MTLRIVFLGTGDYIPTQQRNPKSIYIQRESDHIHQKSDDFLFDVGEGTARQMMKFNIKLNIPDIFLTGIDYDHTGGLSGLLKVYNSTSIQREGDVRIHTPKGTGNKIQEISHIYEDLDFNVEIDEVTPGRVLEKENYAIEAFETDALETSVGYVLREKPRRGRFNREKAENLGVPPGPKFGELVDGNSVRLQNGKTIHPEQVIGDPRPGRKIVYTGDTRPLDSTIKVASHADLLIHDSAFAESWNERAVETGHSTALEAATVADKASSKRLALMSISPRFTGIGFRLRQESESVYDKKVTVAEDGLTIDIPYPDTDTNWEVGYESRSADSFYSVGKRSEKLRNHIQSLREIAESGYFDLPETLANDLSSALDEILSNIENTVLVLGSFKDHHKNELNELRSALNTKGYSANTASELPSHKDKSLRQNVSMYMMLSRFCIMVDREPSGHLNEYEIARSQGDILIRLVPEEGGSTFMIGGEEQVNINNIKSFTFKYDPTESLEEAIEWAENQVEKRRAAFEEEYPWR